MVKTEAIDWMPFVAIVLAIFAIVLVIAKGGGNEFVLQQSEQDLLSVSGNAELFVEPDKAEIYVRIQTLEDTALEAQEENRVISDDVRQALRSAGIDKDDLETSQYRLERHEEYNSETRRYEFEGYRLVNVMKVTTDELDKVGEFIDAAVEAGANGVDSVQFGLSDEQMKASSQEALEKAASEAKTKADALAESLGVRLGGPSRISESNFNFVPYVARDMAMAEDAKAGAPGTVVSPEKVMIRATVSVDYEIR